VLVTVAGSCDEVVEVIGRLWPKMTMVSVIYFPSEYAIHMNREISWFGTVTLIDVYSVSSMLALLAYGLAPCCQHVGHSCWAVAIKPILIESWG
jgi:hypothetical protein